MLTSDRIAVKALDNDIIKILRLEVDTWHCPLYN
jgi:hypothetical protein